jgi:hypothetical protein
LLSYTAPFSITGWPLAAIRVGISEEGLPIGVQIVGKPFQEHVVLARAQARSPLPRRIRRRPELSCDATLSFLRTARLDVTQQESRDARRCAV